MSEQSDDERQAVTSRALVSTAVQISELRVMQEENEYVWLQTGCECRSSGWMTSGVCWDPAQSHITEGVPSAASSLHFCLMLPDSVTPLSSPRVNVVIN